MKNLENRIPPPVLAMALALLMAATARLAPSESLPGAARQAGAALLGALALGFAVPGIGAFLRAGTTINPVDIEKASLLVTGGIFGVTRNPMYVALTALLTAWAFGLGSPWGFAGPLIFAVFIHRFQILPEERALGLKFGTEYAAYRRRVRRWL